MGHLGTNEFDLCDDPDCGLCKRPDAAPPKGVNENTGLREVVEQLRRDFNTPDVNGAPVAPPPSDVVCLMEACRLFCCDVIAQYPEVAKSGRYHDLLAAAVKLDAHPEDAPGGPTRLDVERVMASMLSVIHTWHGDVAWEIYRDNAPELADYRAFVDRLKGDET